MTRKSQKPTDYEIGYGKPPEQNQFVKGRSGNPKGRTKGKIRESIIRAVLNQPVVITKNGRQRKVIFFEAFLNKVVAKALEGTTRDHVLLLRLIQDYAPDLLKESPAAHHLTIEFVDAVPQKSDEN